MSSLSLPAEQYQVGRSSHENRFPSMKSKPNGHTSSHLPQQHLDTLVPIWAHWGKRKEPPCRKNDNTRSTSLVWAEGRGKWAGAAQRKHVCHLEPLIRSVGNGKMAYVVHTLPQKINKNETQKGFADQLLCLLQCRANWEGCVSFQVNAWVRVMRPKGCVCSIHFLREPAYR